MKNIITILLILYSINCTAQIQNFYLDNRENIIYLSTDGYLVKSATYKHPYIILANDSVYVFKYGGVLSFELNNKVCIFENTSIYFWKKLACYYKTKYNKI